MQQGSLCSTGVAPFQRYYGPSRHRLVFDRFPGASGYAVYLAPSISRRDEDGFSSCLVLFFTLNREDFSFVIHLDRQPRTSRRREAQTGSRARSGSRSERTLDAVEHSRTLMEWWPFLIFHRGGSRIKVINNTWHVLVTVLSLPPRQRDVPHQIVWRHILLPSSDTRKLGLWGLFFGRGHLWVHLCYGPVTRSPSSRWLCQSASSVSFPPRT